MSIPFEEFNFDNFWEDSDYAKKEYVGAELTLKMVHKVEQKIGYKLPSSYITLLKSQNGGIPRYTIFPTTERTSWANDHVAIAGILGIDSRKTYSLLGSVGSEFMKSEWGYPDIGIYVCNCPSAGHDMIALDYRKCGKDGEPEVVHVDQELDYKITFLSSNFGEFIIGLVHDDDFDESKTVNIAYLWKPGDISFEIKETNKLQKIGLFLELNQKLAPGEIGWTQSRFHVPQSWGNATLEMKDGRIHICANGKNYYIDKENSGKLSYDILSAGKISDVVLERIWHKCAGEKT
jgi:hypothetical protein